MEWQLWQDTEPGGYFSEQVAGWLPPGAHQAVKAG